MLNLIMLHRNDQMGRKLAKLLSDNLTDVECKDTYIWGIPFIQITLKAGDDAKRVLNPPEGIINNLNKKTIGQMLELNGIPFGHRVGDSIIKYYDVLIFDMNVISIKVRGADESPVKYIKQSECVKIVDMARKSIYVAGLDYGLVTIALTGKRKPRVINIYDAPEIRQKDINVLVNKIIVLKNQDYQTVKVDDEVKMGADPEFMLFNAKSGKMIAASDFFPREGIIGCDNIRIPNRQQRPVAEIRPNPTTSPRELTENIKMALTSANKLAPYRNVRWVAGSQPLSGYSIGGHIHFSNIPINYALLRALDNYLGIIVFLIENPVSAARRRKKYGHLADIRLKEYGGFEYRTPGSWLITPEITCAVLCLAKIVSEHYLELGAVYLNNVDALQAFYQGNQEYFRPLFQKIWRGISRTSSYSEYQEDLKLIPDMIENNVTWDERLDLKVAWKIDEGSKKRYLSNKTKNPVIRNTNTRTSTNGSRNSRALSAHPHSGSIHNTTRIQP